MKFTIICGTILAAAGLGAAAVLPRDAALAPPDTSCFNKGLQWAYYRDNSSTTNHEDTNPSFDPAKNKTDTPLRTGVTDYLHNNWRDGKLYNQTGLLAQWMVVEHRGYLYAPESGTYKFNASKVDDNLYMWIGAAAASGWSKTNSKQYIYWNMNNDTALSNTYTEDLTAGNYYPFRVVYKNTGYIGTFDYTITAPSGKTLITGDHDGATLPGYVIQFSCDNQLAPQYPAFGKEI